MPKIVLQDETSTVIEEIESPENWYVAPDGVIRGKGFYKRTSADAVHSPAVFVLATLLVFPDTAPIPARPHEDPDPQP